jgi:Fe-S-cluster containining protein
MNEQADPSYFFDEGIRFTCVECGQCCKGAPGAVIAVRDEEVQAIADHLGIDRETFNTRYLHAAGQGMSIREKPNGDCIFLEGMRCAIYPVRPTQCRTYPFWFKNLRSEEQWSRACRECPGIGHGRLYARDEILAQIEEDMESHESGVAP